MKLSTTIQSPWPHPSARSAEQRMSDLKKQVLRLRFVGRRYQRQGVRYDTVVTIIAQARSLQLTALSYPSSL